MNINLGVTKNYEMNSPADPAKTKPILPGLKRQLYRTNLSQAAKPRRPREAVLSLSKGHPPPPTSFFPSLTPRPSFSSCLCTATHATVSPTAPAAQLRHSFCPSKPPILTLQFSKNSQRFTHFAYLFERNSATFYMFFLFFSFFSHLETLSNTPNPHFSPNIKGDLPSVKFPNPIFSPKIDLHSHIFPKKLALLIDLIPRPTDQNSHPHC